MFFCVERRPGSQGCEGCRLTHTDVAPPPSRLIAYHGRPLHRGGGRSQVRVARLAALHESPKRASATPLAPRDSPPESQQRYQQTAAAAVSQWAKAALRAPPAAELRRVIQGTRHSSPPGSAARRP